jgi:SPOR domain
MSTRRRSASQSICLGAIAAYDPAGTQVRRRFWRRTIQMETALALPNNVLRISALMFLLSGCSTLPGGWGAAKGDLDGAVQAAELRTAELEVEVAQLKSDKEQLASELEALQSKNDKLAASDEAASAADDAASLADATALANAELKLRDGAATGSAVVEAADGSAIASGAAPVEEAPRLVQPTFASTDAVFENEADGDIETASVLFGVHLASYRKPSEAREGWRKLQRQNPDELGLLEPRIERVRLEEKGVFLRLIGGGFSSQEKAGALCASLQQKGLFCSVSGFNGSRLSLLETG